MTTLIVLMFITNLILVFMLLRTHKTIKIDALTGLLNKRAFDKDLYHKHYRRSNDPKYLILIDVNNFKEINDTQGHFAGDKYLINLADKLLANTRRNEDKVYRIGGDEFAVLTANKDLFHGEIAGLTADKSVSWGVSVLGDDRQATFESADKAMYACKKGNK